MFNSCLQGLNSFVSELPPIQKKYTGKEDAPIPLLGGNPFCLSAEKNVFKPLLCQMKLDIFNPFGSSSFGSNMINPSSLSSMRFNFMQMMQTLFCGGAKNSGSASGKYANEINKIAKEEGIDPKLLSALIKHESGYNPNAKSPVGAVGLCQLMPGTAAGMKVNPYDPVDNIRGGARYLKLQMKRFGSVENALAAYNAGPGAVRKYGGIPPYKETQNYVKNIMKTYNTL